MKHWLYNQYFKEKMKIKHIKITGLVVIFSIVGFILLTNRTFILNLRAYAFHHEKNSQIVGTPLNIDLAPLHAIDKNYGNWLVHPCVRYIEEGLNEHKWWLVTTPYPNHNSQYEQPVLFYGENNDTIPPLNWIYAGLVTNKHDMGYNADPNLFWWDGKLWIIWKEHQTENTSTNCIMISSFDGHELSTPRKILEQRDSTHIGLTAPTLVIINDSIKLLATDFEHERRGGETPFGRNQLAVWTIHNNDLENGQFTYQRSVEQIYPSGFNYWHSEMLATNTGIYYSVVCPESGDKILLGTSIDGERYIYDSTPLLSKRGNMISNMYKASITEVGKSIYLFYPAACGWGQKQSKIHMTKLNI